MAPKKGKKKRKPVGDQLTPGDTVDVPGRKAPGKPPLGSGQRFDNLAASFANRPGVSSPGGLAATVGRNKLGKGRFQKLAARGKPGY